MNPHSPDLPARRRTGVWTVLNRFVIAFIILALCAGGAMLFIPILRKKQAGDERIAALKTEITQQRHLLTRYTREVELLKNDPEYIELIARDRLDRMKPGELIIRMEPGTSTIVPIPESAPLR